MLEVENAIDEAQGKQGIDPTDVEEYFAAKFVEEPVEAGSRYLRSNNGRFKKKGKANRDRPP